MDNQQKLVQLFLKGSETFVKYQATLEYFGEDKEYMEKNTSKDFFTMLYQINSTMIKLIREEEYQNKKKNNPFLKK